MSSPEKHPSLPERRHLSPDISMDELLEILVAGHIPVRRYGTGKAKTIGHLLKEIQEGESIVTVDTKRTVYREVNVLSSDVIHEAADGNVYILKEDRQEFKDGRIKRRKIDLSIGEKLKPSEEPEVGLMRALKEELGIETITGAYDIGVRTRTFIPDTFPGIKSTYNVHRYVSVIPEEEFNPEGYIEHQDDKTNYFVWNILKANPKA